MMSKMKNKKRSLDKLRVESFVTKMENDDNKTAKGGLDLTQGTPCSRMFCSIGDLFGGTMGYIICR